MKKPSAFDEICKSCGACNGTRCFSIQEEAHEVYELPTTFPQNYDGYRFTADAMDCALPISLDSHSGCSFSCLYCFSNNLQRAPDRNRAKLQKIIKEGSFYAEWPIRKLEALLAHDLNDPVAKAMYPLLEQKLPVQLGALGDPLDDLEEHSGWLLKAIPIFIKYNQPVRISTKGARVMLRPEYRKAFNKRPELFWFAFSTITDSDDLIEHIDVKAPNTTQRLQAVKEYTTMGSKCSLRFRPFIPGISDTYPGEPRAWANLITRFAEAGAKAVSFEYIFLNSAPTERQRAMYKLMMRVQRNPKFEEEWNAMSNSKESCRRGSREYKYRITRMARDLTHKLGMAFGVSDPHFKEFNDYGCCCGISPNDPIFGHWSRRQMTNVVVEAKEAYDQGVRRRFTYLDWEPEWAKYVRAAEMIAFNSWHSHRVRKHQTFSDHMRNKWNSPLHPRGPFIYFAGVLQPIGTDPQTQDVVYEYRNWHTKFKQEFKGTIAPQYNSK